jgi:hypothetical protein
VLRLSRIIRDYDEAGSVNSLLTPWGFVDDETFITKAGHVGMVFRLTGVDYECLDVNTRRDVVHRFEAALRVLEILFLGRISRIQVTTIATTVDHVIPINIGRHQATITAQPLDRIGTAGFMIRIP